MLNRRCRESQPLLSTRPGHATSGAGPTGPAVASALAAAATVLAAGLIVASPAALAQVSVDGRESGAVVVRGYADRSAYSSARQRPTYSDPWAAAPRSDSARRAPLPAVRSQGAPDTPPVVAATSASHSGSSIVSGGSGHQGALAAVLASVPAMPSVNSLLTLPGPAVISATPISSSTDWTSAAAWHNVEMERTFPKRTYSQTGLGISTVATGSTVTAPAVAFAPGDVEPSARVATSLGAGAGAATVESAVWRLEPWSQRRYNQTWPNGIGCGTRIVRSRNCGQWYDPWWYGRGYRYSYGSGWYTTGSWISIGNSTSYCGARYFYPTYRTCVPTRVTRQHTPSWGYPYRYSSGSCSSGGRWHSGSGLSLHVRF